MDPMPTLAAQLRDLARVEQRAAELVTVYRISRGDTVLDVGMTTNLKRRLTEHRRRDWWTQGVTVHATKPVPRTLGRLVEATEMQRRRPEHCTHTQVTPPYVNGDWAAARRVRFFHTG